MASVASVMPTSLTGMDGNLNPGARLGRLEEIARALSREEGASGKLTTEGIDKVVKEMGGSLAEVRREAGRMR